MNVLVADDHELVRSSLVSLLQSASIASQINEASNAQETIEQIDQSDFDLIILDLFMPDAQGFDLVRRVCNQQIDAKIVVVSASQEASDIRKALDLGASAYIPKSVGTSVMLSAIQLVIAGGVYIPEVLLNQPSSNETRTASPSSEVAGRSVEPEFNLSKRQHEVLSCLVAGMSNKEIARQLDLSEYTAKAHVATLFKILGVSNRTKAAKLALELGIIQA